MKKLLIIKGWWIGISDFFFQHISTAISPKEFFSPTTCFPILPSIFKNYVTISTSATDKYLMFPVFRSDPNIKL